MNDTVALLQQRRSVAPQLLAEPGPGPAETETLLTIAARVPDHGRLAPWRFIVIEGEARTRIGETIAAAFRADQPGADEGKVAFERNRLARAPLVIAVVSRVRPHAKIPEWEQTLSGGAVCMNLLTAASAMGYGASWLTEWYAFDRRVLDALGLAADERIAGFVHIGTASEKPSDRPRPALADIVSRL
ncbi:MAG TPA: nitroreductase [Microvirga sp.]|jgi:nitroreductase|nr:nitroreductase [Microvirga sp.]